MHDGPQLALASSVISPDPHVIVGVIVGNSEVFSTGNSLDSVGVSFSFESESLIGSSMEAVDNQIAKVSHILSDIQSFEAISMNCVDDVVLVGSKMSSRLERKAHVEVRHDVRDLREVACPMEALSGFDELSWCWDETLSLLPFVGLFRLGVDRFKQPNLIAAMVNVVLKDAFSFLGFSASKIKGTVIGMSLDDVSFIGVRSLFSPNHIEPAAVMFSRVGDNMSSIVMLITEDTESIFVRGHQSVFVLFQVDGELLIFIASELLDYNIFGLRIHSKGNVLVENRDNFVCGVGVWLEAVRNVGNDNFFEEPYLVAILMDVVLENILSFFSLSSSNIEGSVINMSLDEIAFMDERTFIGSYNIEPAAVMLAGVGNYLSAIVLLVTEDAKSFMTTTHDESEFIVLRVYSEFLVDIVVEGLDGHFLVGAHC